MADTRAAIVAAMRSHPCVTVLRETTQSIEFEANPTVASIQAFLADLFAEPGLLIEKVDNRVTMRTDRLNFEPMWAALARAWDANVQARYHALIQ